jgi:hypothetical protein
LPFEFITKILTEPARWPNPFIIHRLMHLFDEYGDMNTASSTIVSTPFTQVC